MILLFKSPEHYRTFLTILMTYTLDLVGFSIVFPVLAPLLLNPQLNFFSPETIEAARTTVLGLLFAIFGIAQFVGALIAGVLADYYGRYKVFLGTIGVSIFGYAVMSFGVFEESLLWLFLGRALTGFCSGNVGLAQSATADLTDSIHRTKAFGILLGMGSLGFIIGPWIGGKLANPDWLFGSGAFIFAGIAALINFLIVFFFFVETWKPSAKHLEMGLFSTFKDLSLVLHHKSIRTILIAILLFCVGWGFFLIFSPTFLVQRFSLGSNLIGDIFAYMAAVWFFVSMFLNKELAGRFSLRSLILVGTLTTCVGIGLFLWPENLWPYWVIIPIALGGGALSWVNLTSLLSIRASEDMQGRAMGASGSMWSIGQIVAPLAAGPLAGWNIYSPLLVGAAILFFCFLYFLICYQEHARKT